MKIKAIVFDLDNTLIDFMKMKREATKAAAWAMVEAGLEAEREDLSTRLFDFYLKYDIESDDAFEKFLRKTCKKVEPRVLAAAVNAYLKEKALHLRPYPGVGETLSMLKQQGFKLAVVTDGLRLKAWMRLNAAGLDKYFSVVVTYDDTGKKKPDGKPFKKAMSELQCKPGECLMVGDWPERDLIGAKAAGMWTCWARYGSGFEEGQADSFLWDIRHIFKSIKALEMFHP